MKKWIPGQRWISEMEPDLGMGTILNLEGRILHVLYPAAGEVRQYAAASPPIRRVRFQPGDRITTTAGHELIVESVEEVDGLFTYHTDGDTVPEGELGDTTGFSSPEDRLLNGLVDDHTVFDLRLETLQHHHRLSRSPAKGFVGARIDILPHQLYIAQDVSARSLPRVLLSDEVGLGKTIEACLILHRLLLTGRVARTLILVPDALVHQWFVELLRRFNLTFSIFDEGRCLSLQTHGSTNAFLDDQLVLASMDWLGHSKRWGEQVTLVDWDMVIVDEAHHLEWAPENASPLYRLVEILAKQSPGLLLLTATPEQFGEAGHFARLHLLDRERYPDLEQFLGEADEYHRVADAAGRLIESGKLSKDEQKTLLAQFGDTMPELETMLADVTAGDMDARDDLIVQLLDRHGPGRVLFRNTRSALHGFPERVPCLVPLDVERNMGAVRKTLAAERALVWGYAGKGDAPGYDNDERVVWLADFLRRHQDKVLLICRTRAQVEAIDAALRNRINVKQALFHEGLPLIQRDRNAAWFSEVDGARILICSEIGGEGRNFQFAHHLVLFDLPLDPELVEQRIGRLDRIGQRHAIQVHVPYLKDTWQEVMVRWYHEGLRAFSSNLDGGYEMLQKCKARLVTLAAAWSEGRGNHDELEKLIVETRSQHEELLEHLQCGRDRLLELHSFRPEKAKVLVESIQALDKEPLLEDFAMRLLDHFGVSIDDLDHQTYLLQPSHLLTDALPELPSEGTLVTLSRKQALEREDIDFLTWDHPLVVGAMELLRSLDQGNSTVAVLQGVDAHGLFLDLVFILEPVADRKLFVDRFLPPTPIRVVVDQSLGVCTESWIKEGHDARLLDGASFRVLDQREALQQPVREMTDRGLSEAEVLAANLREDARSVMKNVLDSEIDRLEYLQKINDHVSEAEIVQMRRDMEAVEHAITGSRLRLDALRLCVAMQSN